MEHIVKAVDANLLELLHKSEQFIVPVYQRLYSWGREECEQLWKDIVRAGNVSADSPAEHFTGSIVYVEADEGMITRREPNLIIDGQQRVTTVMLLLTALAKRLEREPDEDYESKYEGFMPDKIRNWYLIDQYASGDRRYKLLLSQRDKDTFKSIINGVVPDPEQAPTSERLVANYRYFASILNRRECDLAAVCRGLRRLRVVDIHLTRGTDNPQLVFESMNSTGKKLSQTDLIRNYVLMDMPSVEQDRLYESHWRPMERLLGDADERWLDEFMRDYLTMKTRRIPNKNKVYDEFRDYSDQWHEAGRTIDELVKDLHEKAGYFACIALEKESQPKLRKVFNELRDFRATVSYPMLMECYSDYRSGIIDADDMAKITEMIISYMLRRSACAIPPNSMDNMFSTFNADLPRTPDRYLDDIRAKFALMENKRRYPDDDEFREALKHNDVYHTNRIKYLLDKLENAGRKEYEPTAEYTIEHIMPQNPELSEGWREALGPDWRDVQKEWLHTLGNLTLTGYNSEMSDHDFADKRDSAKGFGGSRLRLNEGLNEIDTWNAEQIERRADRLAELAVDIWPGPGATKEMIERYQELRAKRNTTEEKEYSLEKDHPELLHGNLGELFRRVDETVRSWDADIERRVTKYYVGYHLGQMFLSIIPYKDRLGIGLTILREDLDDEQGLAIRKENRPYGGIHCEVILPVDASDGDVTYTMGLAWQSYQNQLDE